MVADVQGADVCPRFSCGHLRNISSPFHRRDDPPWCGSQYYELECSDRQAEIRIGNDTYYVVGINYTDSFFTVVDANLDTSSSCSLPAGYSYPEGIVDAYGFANLEASGAAWACFANCSRAITNNSLYKPVACLSAKHSFVYVWADSYACEIAYLEHSCRYSAMAPFDGSSFPDVQLGNTSYADIMDYISKGFDVGFPTDRNARPFNSDDIIKLCLSNSTRSVYSLHWIVGHD